MVVYGLHSSPAVSPAKSAVRHSYFKATMGSSFAARRAGM